MLLNCWSGPAEGTRGSWLVHHIATRSSGLEDCGSKDEIYAESNGICDVMGIHNEQHISELERVLLVVSPPRCRGAGPGINYQIRISSSSSQHPSGPRRCERL
jgi:hypothetical protein